MQLRSFFLTLAFGLALPGFLAALTNEERHGIQEIAQGWVDRHNEGLDDVVKDAVKNLRVKVTGHRLKSLSRKPIRMKGLYPHIATKHDIPLRKTHSNGAPVSLVALYQAQAQGQSFLIADYGNERTDLDSTTDIYWKVGLVYRPVPLFHGEGYRGCARVITLGADSPLFFEIGTYRGGVRCDKVLYSFNRPALSMVSEHLFEAPESVKPENYLVETLKVSVWKEGYTLYRDVDGDGLLEVVNVSKSPYPHELQEKLKKKYHMVDNDFQGAFRKTATVYKWNDEGTVFDEIGDWYF